MYVRAPALPLPDPPPSVMCGDARVVGPARGDEACGMAMSNSPRDAEGSLELVGGAFPLKVLVAVSLSAADARAAAGSELWLVGAWYPGAAPIFW